jgi:CRISPR/Cas system-associated exonuclease Cas4 (RecB family)
VSLEISPPDAVIPESRPLTAYMGQSAWAQSPRQPLEPIFQPDEKMPLSPSALSTFFQCPRRYYFEKLVGLRSETTPEAGMGTLIHKLMEVFNKQCRPETHTVSELTRLAERLFDLDETAGFDAKTLAEVSELSALTRVELKRRLLAALTDLNEKGYFQEPIRSVVPEKGYDNLEIEPLGPCQVTVRMDALLERPDGTWDLVDYKFYGPNQHNLKSADPNKLAERILSALEPLPEGELSHGERFKSTDAKPRNPQLPLYYLTTQQDPDFKGKIRSTWLQIIRPPFPDNSAQGAIRLAVTSEQLDAGLDQWVSDIRQYVVEPTVAATVLPVNPARHCTSCSFLAVCEAAGNDGEEEGDHG